MKRVVFCVLLFASVIVSWGVFAQQRNALKTASIESRPATSDQRMMEQSNKR